MRWPLLLNKNPPSALPWRVKLAMALGWVAFFFAMFAGWQTTVAIVEFRREAILDAGPRLEGRIVGVPADGDGRSGRSLFSKGQRVIIEYLSEPGSSKSCRTVVRIGTEPVHIGRTLVVVPGRSPCSHPVISVGRDPPGPYVTGALINAGLALTFGFLTLLALRERQSQ